MLDPGIRLLASRWFLTAFTLLAVSGTVGLVYVLVTGVDLSPNNVFRLGVMLILSYMAIGLSMEARKAA
jgi:hypothetical protein